MVFRFGWSQKCEWTSTRKNNESSFHRCPNSVVAQEKNSNENKTLNSQISRNACSFKTETIINMFLFLVLHPFENSRFHAQCNLVPLPRTAQELNALSRYVHWLQRTEASGKNPKGQRRTTRKTNHASLHWGLHFRSSCCSHLAAVPPSLSPTPHPVAESSLTPTFRTRNLSWPLPRYLQTCDCLPSSTVLPGLAWAGRLPTSVSFCPHPLSVLELMPPPAAGGIRHVRAGFAFRHRHDLRWMGSLVSYCLHRLLSRGG